MHVFSHSGQKNWLCCWGLDLKKAIENHIFCTEVGLCLGSGHPLTKIPEYH